MQIPDRLIKLNQSHSKSHSPSIAPTAICRLISVGVAFGPAFIDRPTTHESKNHYEAADRRERNKPVKRSTEWSAGGYRARCACSVPERDNQHGDHRSQETQGA